MNYVLLGLFVYILAQLLIAFYVSRRTKSEDDYLLAGRSLGPGIAVFTIFATWFGAETCVGSAAIIYEDGMAELVHDPFGYGLCLIVMGLFFAAPLWKKKIMTVADLFRQRYGVEVEKAVGIIIIPTSIFWAAAQIRAFGHVLSASSEMTTALAISIAAAIVIVYTSFGGLMADAITDLIQGITLIIGLIILFAVIVMNLPEGTDFMELLPRDKIAFPGSNATSIWDTLEMWTVPVFGSLMAQELISRALAARSANVARYSAISAGGLYLVVGLLPVIIGLLAVRLMPGVESVEEVLPLMAQKYLSPVLYTIFAGALLSAILSTVDSTLLAAAAIASHNIILPFLKTRSEYKKVWVARVCVIVSGLVAYILALHASNIYELIEQTNGFGASGLFVITLFAMFTSWGGTYAALGSFLLSTGIWAYATYINTEAIPYPFLTSFIAAVSAYVILGLAEKIRPAVSPQQETI